jgi:transposase InsO family protein
MSGKGNCYDNAMVKTFFKTMQSELVWRTTFFTRADADGPLPDTSTDSTTSFGAILHSATSDPHSSKNRRSVMAMPLHFTGESPALGKRFECVNA